MSYLYFNDESDYSEENTCGNNSFALPLYSSSVNLLYIILE